MNEHGAAAVLPVIVEPYLYGTGRGITVALHYGALPFWCKCVTSPDEPVSFAVITFFLCIHSHVANEQLRCIQHKNHVRAEPKRQV